MKPFVKWAGGKGRLLNTLDTNLPVDIPNRTIFTYVEPFVGGGSMLFHMLRRFPNIRAIINDINPALINCYLKIRDQHTELIKDLRKLSDEYTAIYSTDERKVYYYAIRDEYNRTDILERQTIRSAVLFMFLNRTCFNGLYRENNQGGFNVPVGRYKSPRICNEQIINEAHKALQNVEILHGDYQEVINFVDWNTYNFFYLDPPYRPLFGSNNFNKYTYNDFDDEHQNQLKDFCDEIDLHGGRFLLSNSDSEIEPGVNFFELLYEGYRVQRIFAPRTINAFVPGVERVAEILVKNY